MGFEKKHRTVSTLLKGSALIQCVLIITSFFGIFTFNISWIPTGNSWNFAGSTENASITIRIVDSIWIINPGGTFTVYLVVINNENIQLENVDVYTYVSDGENVLNVGGMFSNKTTITLAPNENENLALEITIKENTTLGSYYLMAAAELPDNRSYDDNKNISLDIEKQITLDAWIYPQVDPDYHKVVISKYSYEHNTGYLLKIENAPGSDFRIVFALGPGGGSWGDNTRWVWYDTPFEARWWHVVGTYDGVTQKLYVDGALVGSLRWSGTIATNNLPLLVGAEYRPDLPGDYVHHFDGIIDEVRVSDVALTP